MKTIRTALTLAAGLCLGGCGAAGGPPPLEGTIRIDGSSTVFPLSDEAARRFHQRHPGVVITVGISGTSGGFRHFIDGETDVSNASRMMNDDEFERARTQGLDPVEIRVAYDGISVVTHPENDFVDVLTVQELSDIWRPDSRIERWGQVRRDWPDEKIVLLSPGRDSGTLDYFAEVINGNVHAIRHDVMSSEDDNVLVEAIAAQPHALAFFGHAYYHRNAARLKLIAIDSGRGPVMPSPGTIASQEYQPLSRPLFLYVDRDKAQRRDVRAFLEFYLESAPQIAERIGYIPLRREAYASALTALRQLPPPVARE